MAFSGKIYWVGEFQDHVNCWDSSTGEITRYTAEHPGLTYPTTSYVFDTVSLRPDGVLRPHNDATVGNGGLGPIVYGSGSLGDFSDSTGVGYRSFSDDTEYRQGFIQTLNGYANHTPNLTGMRIRATGDGTPRGIPVLPYGRGQAGITAFPLPYDEYLGGSQVMVSGSIAWYEMPLDSPYYTPINTSGVGYALQAGNLDILGAATINVTVWELELDFYLITGVEDVTPSFADTLGAFGALSLMPDGTVVAMLDKDVNDPWGIRFPAGLQGAPTFVGGPGNGSLPVAFDFNAVGNSDARNMNGVLDADAGLTWFFLPHSNLTPGEPIDYAAIEEYHGFSYTGPAWTGDSNWFTTPRSRDFRNADDIVNAWMWAGVNADGVIVDQLGFLAGGVDSGGGYAAYHSDSAWSYSNIFSGNTFKVGTKLYINYGPTYQSGLSRWDTVTNVVEYTGFDTSHFWVGYGATIGFVSVNETTGDIEVWDNLDSLDWGTDPFPSLDSVSPTRTITLPGVGSYYWENGFGQLQLDGAGSAYYFVELEYGVDWNDVGDYPDNHPVGNSSRMMQVNLLTGEQTALFDVPYLYLDATGQTTNQDGYVLDSSGVGFGIVLTSGETPVITGQLDSTRVRFL